jgi:hypothetical protein
MKKKRMLLHLHLPLPESNRLTLIKNGQNEFRFGHFYLPVRTFIKSSPGFIETHQDLFQKHIKTFLQTHQDLFANTSIPFSKHIKTCLKRSPDLLKVRNKMP